MAKGYTKRALRRLPRASRRGRIVRHADRGRVIMEIEKSMPDGSILNIQQHATKGIRIYRQRYA